MSIHSVLTLVQFDNHDVSGLIELSASVGWDYDGHEIGTVLKSGKIFGHKTEEGNIVSSAAIIPYDSKLASIGMVIVKKEFRGLGLGKKATQKCIDSVSNDTSIMLIATEEGKPLYERMGFITVDSVNKYICDNYETTIPLTYHDVMIEKFRETDFDKVLKLDQESFGDQRSTFLRNRINQSEQSLVIKDSEANIIGFGLSILGPLNLIVGPIVAPNTQMAALILDKLASNHKGRLRIDVPSEHTEFMFMLEKSGFKQVSKPSIMMKNSTKMPLRNHSLFGIAAQIFG